MICTFNSPEDIDIFKMQALKWACSFNTACYYDSNHYADPYSAFDVMIAAGKTAELQVNEQGAAFDALKNFLSEHNTLVPGFLSYDLKNELEQLSSNNMDKLHFPDLYFFVPEHLLLLRGNQLEIRSTAAPLVYEDIKSQQLEKSEGERSIQVESRFSKEEYLACVNEIKQHILRGDIYEANFCQEFYADKISINPRAIFQELNQLSPTPFANFFKVDDKYILSASPERFLSKRHTKLISQPIKGTAKRGDNPTDDEELKENLRKSQKEQSENVMIVDLVRNDLTKCSVPGSVGVEELFGVYSFRQVHQMISTVTSMANPALDNTDIIKATFPMGSMTGAPKIRAMELIEQYEKTRRGVFSGAVGYFDGLGDFDFNVVIRTILYNARSGYLSFSTGSAITYDSVAEKEYEECLLKAEAILKVLK
ncbi:anthranilate synthase component I family protein [Pedobacter sp. SYSU D00535]|uniref:anthranilate synthase component I family protein n=1 Tax=Pedobacter sp. SYSU D00535 TaxID=2810308 RepID=UPI001A9789DD|nr:anthranilate synthase component I family protein [Pedobacter sp. SYSU D00535]